MRSFDSVIHGRNASPWIFAILAVFSFLIGLAGTAPAGAQTITGAVRGTVTDPSGAVVSKAEVTAVNTATGVSSSTVSDQNGLYNFPFLPIGTYIVRASAPGFDTISLPAFRLEIDQIANVNIKLQVGQASTTVNVSSEISPILNTENATLGLTLTAGTIANIPLNGPNFSTLTEYLPGSVSPEPTGFAGSDSIERDTSSADVPSFNGNRQQTNNYILDGADINESFSDDIGYNPSPEAIEQIRVITANADAEYGNVNGGEILLSTKSGTNRFHGSAYDFLENDNLNANTWANDFSRISKSNYTQQVFGATLGGPVLRNRLFFFGDYEGVRYHTGGEATASVAPAAFRQGNFSLLTASHIQLYNSQNGFTPYLNDQNVPINNPVAVYLFAHPEAYPLPNRTPTDGIAQNDYLGYQKSFTGNDQGDLRIDYTLDARDSIMGRYSRGDAYDGVAHPVLPISFPAADDYPVWGLVLNWTHVLSTSVVNELRASFTRLGYGNSNIEDPTGLFGVGGNAAVGIPGPQSYAGFSEMDMTSGTIGSFGTTDGIYGKRDNNFLYADDFTWQHGKHVSKFGAEFLRYQQNNFDPGNDGTLGLFEFSGQFTGDPGLGESIGYPFADFLLDDSSYAGVGGVRGYTGQRQWRDAFFAQDDWKLLPRLTVNLGVRYEYDQPIYEVNNKEVNVNLTDPSLGTKGLEYAGQDGNSRALYNPVYTNFMPRLGFAWQAGRRMVVRGGYGTTVDLEGTGSSLRLTQNPPYEYSFTAQAITPTASSPGAPLQVTNGFATAPGNVSVSTTQYYAWDANLRPSFIQQFSLTSEYEISNATSVQIGYIGETGQHLIVPIDGNQWTSPCSKSCTSAPFHNLVGQTGAVDVTASEGMSNYNALQAIVRHRQTNGLEYTVNYTYAHSLTNNPGFYGVPGVNGPSPYWQDAYDPAADYGPSGFDIRQNATATGYYELPFGHNRRFGGNWNLPMNEALGGWKIAGSGTLYTGFPITIDSPNNANTNAFAARANHYLPLQVRDRSVSNWFGTDPSAIPCSGAFNGVCAYGAELPNSYGSAGVGTERGPGYRDMDLSLFKTFAIAEAGQGIDFRADFFNAFNLASYADPANSVSSTNFGQITATRSPQREIQLSMRYHF
ncbi:MAG TPA: TonB-dependent receptor [Acidobacteriaceae bacterium]|nr:TonB-dependent receptor [Acidobacteriaceae bacterium]